jgi:hypothetical protein
MTGADTATTPYIALLLSVSSSGAPDHRPLYEEDVVLVHATSVEHARHRAGQLGERRRTSYRNDRGETITWAFLRIVDVAPVLYEDLSVDTELYSRHFRDIEAYDRFDTDVRRDDR